MPNVRMTSAQMKAKAKAAAAKNKAKSKMGSPATKKGKAKPAAAVKNRKVYKKIKSTSTYNPKLIKESDEKLEMASPMNKSKQKVEQDYARNAIADYKSGKTKEAKYEKKKALELAAGESGVMMKGSPYHKHGSPYHMGYKNSPMNITTDQESKLPPALVKEIKKKEGSAPQMKGSPYHMSDELKYGGPVIDQMKTLSQISASKVLRHMKK